AVLKCASDKLCREEREPDLIDAGAEEIEVAEDVITVYTKFVDFGNFQKFIEARGLDARSSELPHIPNTTTALPEDQQDDVLKLIEALEGDDDVQAVYHTLQ